MLPDTIVELQGPSILEILESLKHESIDEIEPVDLENDYNAKLIFMYLVGTGELPDRPINIYEGFNNINGQQIYIFIQGDGAHSLVYASEFYDILEGIKNEKLMSVLHGKKFLNALESRNLDIRTLRELPLIPHNIKSTAISTDIPYVEFTDAYRLYQIKSFGSTTINFTIKFSDKGEYAFYENINPPQRGKRSRRISQVYPDVKEVYTDTEGAIKLDPEEETREPWIQWGIPKEG